MLFFDDTLWFWIGDLLLAAVCDVMVSSANIVLGFSALPSLWSFETLLSFFQLPSPWSFLNYMLLCL